MSDIENQYIKWLSEAIKVIFTLKGLKPMTKWIIIVALTALIAVGFLCDVSNAQEGLSDYAVSGIYVNNGRLFGLFGYAHRASKHISYFIQSESGGNELAFGTFPVATFGISERITLGALLGPQVEIIQEDPTTAETITYLGASTGLCAVWQVSDDTGIWIAGRYMFIEESVKPFKIGAGLIIAIK